jgi:IS5 family transposase
MQKPINFERMEQKRRSRDGIRIKNVSKPHFGYKVHRIIDRDYELIRSFKTTTHNFVILK